MKKSLLISILLYMFSVCSLNAQISGIMNKVKNAVTDEILGGDQQTENKPAPEPACACSQPTLVLDLGGNLNLDYSEVGIMMQDDGSLLVSNPMNTEYYVVRDGVTKGPYKSDDPQLTKYNVSEDRGSGEEWFITKYGEYFKKSGDKYLLTFMGKSYGPYAMINEFIVTKSKDKFAAMVVQDEIITEDLAAKMNEAMKNAKTDEEKRALAIQFSQQMQAGMFVNGKPADITPKLVSNIPGATYDLMSAFGGKLNGKIKYDDIVVLAPDKIMDLKGNTLVSLKQGDISTQDIILNTDNSKYAWYSSGTLSFSDNTTMSELFNPFLLKEAGKVYLAYMYYSPKNNSVMQCKIPF